MGSVQKTEIVKTSQNEFSPHGPYVEHRGRSSDIWEELQLVQLLQLCTEHIRQFVRIPHSHLSGEVLKHVQPRGDPGHVEEITFTVLFGSVPEELLQQVAEERMAMTPLLRLLPSDPDPDKQRKVDRQTKKCNRIIWYRITCLLFTGCQTRLPQLNVKKIRFDLQEWSWASVTKSTGF